MPGPIVLVGSLPALGAHLAGMDGTRPERRRHGIVDRLATRHRAAVR